MTRVTFQSCEVSLLNCAGFQQAAWPWACHSELVEQWACRTVSLSKRRAYRHGWKNAESRTGVCRKKPLTKIPLYGKTP